MQFQRLKSSREKLPNPVLKLTKKTPHFLEINNFKSNANNYTISILIFQRNLLRSLMTIKAYDKSIYNKKTALAVFYFSEKECFFLTVAYYLFSSPLSGDSVQLKRRVLLKLLFFGSRPL